MQSLLCLFSEICHLLTENHKNIFIEKSKKDV